MVSGGGYELGIQLCQTRLLWGVWQGTDPQGLDLPGFEQSGFIEQWLSFALDETRKEL